MKISIDLDDVVSDLANPFLDFYNKKTGDNISVENLESFQWYNFMNYCDSQEHLGRYLKEFTSDGVFQTIPAVSGAVEGIRTLHRHGHETYFISARNSAAIHDTYKWFLTQGLPVKNIYFDRDKGWLTEHLNIDIHLDDAVHNLESVFQVGVVPILFDRPWNRSNDSFQRVYSWKEFLGVVDRIHYNRLENLTRLG